MQSTSRELQKLIARFATFLLRRNVRAPTFGSGNASTAARPDRFTFAALSCHLRNLYDARFHMNKAMLTLPLIPSEIWMVSAYNQHALRATNTCHAHNRVKRTVAPEHSQLGRATDPTKKHAFFEPNSRPKKTPKREGRKSCNQLLENYKNYLHDSRPSGLGEKLLRTYLIVELGKPRSCTTCDINSTRGRTCARIATQTHSKRPFAVVTAKPFSTCKEIGEETPNGSEASSLHS